jgi:probable HAF family extracellular repeat protein
MPSIDWEKQTGMVDLGSFGGTCTLAADLSERGLVVGSSNLKGDAASEAFLWDGTLHHLGGSLGGDYTGAFAVNEVGQAVGFGYVAGNLQFHATLWKQLGKITDLGVLGSDLCSYAADINAQGQVVGSSGSDCSSESNVFTAFLWDKDTLFDLNTLIPPTSPLFLETAQTINDHGEIAGQGVDSSGNEHAFLLIPCDENHPNVEGCDYSLVDAGTAPQVNSSSVPQGPTSPRRARQGFPSEFNPLLRFGQRLGPWNRALGAQTPTPTSNRNPSASMTEDQCPGGHVPDDAKADYLLDSHGYCGESDGKLTGYCMVSNFVGIGCISVKSEDACPQGAKAKKPGLTKCCGRMNCVEVPVDLDSRCP